MMRILIVIFLVVALTAQSIQIPASVQTQGSGTPLDNYEIHFHARSLQIIKEVGCGSEETLNEADGENVPYVLIAKVALIRLGYVCDGAVKGTVKLDKNDLIHQINNRLLIMNSGRVGSAIKCGGDYDSTLRGLVWIAYNFRSYGISSDAYQHMTNLLLSIRGIRKTNYSYHPSSCGNDENHSGSPKDEISKLEQIFKLCEALGNIDCISGPPSIGDDDSSGCFSDAGAFIGCIALAFLAIFLALFNPTLALTLVTTTAAVFSAVTGGLSWLLPIACINPILCVIAAGFGSAAIAVDNNTNIPETENHILQIETSRFLINNLTIHDLDTQLHCNAPYSASEVKDSFCTNETLRSVYDNFSLKNRTADFLQNYLQNILKNDFNEYNSRPYERYSILAIQNLYDFACALEIPCSANNLRIRTTARTVLDYLSAKFAISSNGLRRFAPYRRQATRKAKFEFPDFFGEHADSLTGRFAIYVGQNGLPPCSAANYDEICISKDIKFEMMMAAVSQYRVPIPILELLAPFLKYASSDSVVYETTPVLQRFNHSSTEIYYNSPSFLLSAGGIDASATVKHSFLDQEYFDDKGVALWTLLIPSFHVIPDGNNASNLIGFRANQTIVAKDKESPITSNSPNLCVDRNFACGTYFYIPQAYLSCNRIIDSLWIFIDTSQCSKITTSLGMNNIYIAAYKSDGSFGCTIITPECVVPLENNFGLMEVVEATTYIRRNLGFNDFVKDIQSNNKSKSFSADDNKPPNDYVTSDGRHIQFNPSQATIIGSNNNGMLATGDAIRAFGNGCIVVNSLVKARITKTSDSYNMRKLYIISLVDVNHPFTAESSFAPPYFYNLDARSCDYPPNPELERTVDYSGSLWQSNGQ